MIYIHETNHSFFKSLARVVKYYLQQSGIESAIIKNIASEDIDITDENIYILNYISFKEGIRKKKYIAIQTEPLHCKDFKEYKIWLNNAIEVWDYSTNLHIGYSKIWKIEKEESKDIDVLFYGALNERRINILDNVKKTIPNIVILENIYGKNLEKTLIDTKIVLCFFYYDNLDNDMSRIAPLICKRNFLIAETCEHSNFNWLKECIVTSSVDKLGELCKYYLDNPAERLKQIDKSYDYLKNNYSFNIQNTLIKNI